MAVYKTAQREELLHFLNAHSREAMTISEMYKLMHDSEDYSDIPAQSSIYRLVRDMTDEGILKRTVKGNSRHFVYQLLPCENCKNHIHMKCSVCGCIYHLSEEESNRIKENILRTDSFVLESDTILSGKCYKCK